MGFSRCLFFTLTAFTIVSPLSESKTLTWNEAVNLAVQNSLELQAAQANFNSVESLETGSYSGFLPSLSASISGNHSGAPGTDSTRTYSASLNLSQNLFSGFSDLNTYFLRQTSTKSASAAIGAVKSRLSQELKQAYAEVFYIQEFKKLITDIKNRRKENARNIKLQYEVGRENKGSVLQSESYVDQAEFDVLSAFHQEEVLVENLKRILGLMSDESLQVTEHIDAEPEMMGARPDFNSLAARHPDVVIAMADEESSLYSLRISRARFMPSLDVSGSYGYADTKFFPENDRWSIGLTFSIPIFEGFKNYSSYRSNRFKNENLAGLAKNKLLQIRTKLKQTYNDYTEAVLQEKIDINFGKAALFRADIARSKYKNGFLSFEDWDVIESDLILKQKAILSSAKNRVIKKSLWEQAQGVGVLK